MWGETRAECVVRLFRTLWRNGHNFQQSTTHFEGLTMGPCMAAASGASEGQVAQDNGK
jgi:hypothetical protein